MHDICYDTVLQDPRVLGYLVHWAGADHVVLGSDYPFPMGDLSPVETLDATSSVSAEDQALITHGNVQALLDGIRR